MIEISQEAACMLYLGLALSIIAICWYKSGKKLKKKEVLSYSLTSRTCEYCMHTFSDNAHALFFRCPECHLLNNVATGSTTKPKK